MTSSWEWSEEPVVFQQQRDDMLESGVSKLLEALRVTHADSIFEPSVIHNLSEEIVFLGWWKHDWDALTVEIQISEITGDISYVFFHANLDGDRLSLVESIQFITSYFDGQVL